MINHDKAFTLIELLAVIVILAIILVIAVPQILNVIGQAREDTYSNQLKLIDEATRLYVVSGQYVLSEGENKILLRELVSNGLIKEIKTSETTCEGYVIVTKEGDDITYDPYMKCGDSYITDGYVGLGFIGADIHQGTVPSGYTGIYTIEDLNNIRNGLTGKYILMNDLDFNSDSSYANVNNKTTYTTGSGWDPIGNSTTYFRGTLDGNNYIIKSLYINRTSTSYVGLIGYASTSTFVLEKLGLEDLNITGGTNTGGFVGYQNGGNIRNVYSTGRITGTNSYTGGIVGYSYATIEKVYSSAEVIGTNYVGGISGSISILRDSFFCGKLSCVNFYVGYIKPNMTSSTTNAYYSNNTTYTGSEPSKYESISFPENIIKTEAFYNGVLGWDIENIWDISGEGYPRLGGTLDVTNHTYSTSITTIEDLFSMYRNTSENYVLMNDIDFNNIRNYRNENNMTIFTTESGWMPMGYRNTFNGSFDGGGHTISNLYINRPTEDYIGLFGYSYNSTTKEIKNIKLKDVNITGKKYVGGIVGYCNNMLSMTNNTVTGSISGSNQYVGGLIGYQTNGTISNNYTSVNVTGAGDTGGLIGYQLNGTTSKNYTTGNVSGTGQYVGGLIGRQGGGTATNNYTTGNVSGTINYVGGIVGYQSSGVVSNSYSKSSVSGTTSVGGIVGYSNNGTLSNSFYNGVSITCTDSCGGVSGLYSGTITNAYYNLSATGASTNTYGLQIENGYIENDIFYDFLLGWDVENTWNVSGEYPVFGSTPNGHNITPTTSITKIEDLLGMIRNMSETYTLMNDLDFNNSNDYYYPELKSFFTTEKGWIPIGQSGLNYFKGSFDGGGHTISNLYINRPTEDFIGLFGRISSSTAKEIKNLNLTNVNITGKQYVGGLAGRSADYTTITNNRVTGSVSGTNQYVGGLIGYQSSGTISINNTAVTITGTDSVGGLVGYKYNGTTSNNYTTGNVSGTNQYVGGLIGYEYSGTTSNNYTTGNVSGTGKNVGGLIGYKGGGTTSNNYTTGNVSGTNYYVGGLVGQQQAGVVSNSYSTASVSGTDAVGGLVGYLNGTLSNSFYTGTSITCTASGCGRVCGMGLPTVTNVYYNLPITVTGASPNSYGTSVTTTELQNLTSTGLNTWDTSTIWQINSGLYPTLR